MMSYESICAECNRICNDIFEYRCTCGSPYELRVNVDFDKTKIKMNEYSVWRYINQFPYTDENKVVTLGEGWTPLTKVEDNLYLKLDFLNPTGSFKDRGSTTLISAIHHLLDKDKSFIAEDSSGNAGASIAAYSARAGLKAKIYVPAAVSGQKFHQILFYGSEVRQVEGTRNEVALEAQREESNKHYIGHIFHPIFRDGMKSLSYEIAEHFGWQLPDRIYLPVSAGTLLLGMIKGFEDLIDSGIVKKLPTLIACQTKQISPLYHKIREISYNPPKKITSIADALVSINPPLLGLMARKIKKMKGGAEIVDEKQIFDNFKELANKGFFVEPSSAVAYAAYKKHLKMGEISKKEETVIVLTGNGLKTSLRP